MDDQTYEPSHDGWERDDHAFQDVVDQLSAYFAGELTEFDVELDMIGTDFQRRVWQALTTIPYGETRTYGELAARIGSPRGTRARRPVCRRHGRRPSAAPGGSSTTRRPGQARARHERHGRRRHHPPRTATTSLRIRAMPMIVRGC